MKNNKKENFDLFTELNNYVNNLATESVHTDYVYYTLLYKLAKDSKVEVYKEYENAFRIIGEIDNVKKFFATMPKKEFEFIYNPIYTLNENILKLLDDEKYWGPENGSHMRDNETRCVVDGKWYNFIEDPSVNRRVIKIKPVDLSKMIRTLKKTIVPPIDAVIQPETPQTITVVFEFNCENRANLILGDTALGVQDVEQIEGN